MMSNRTPAKLMGHISSPIWGGDRLSRAYKRFSGKQSIGEVWETSVTAGCESTAFVGDKEHPLSEYFTALGVGHFPLVKLISASAPLSLQVHPDDTAAALHGGTAKSELWYVLSADDDASIIYGTSDGKSYIDVSAALACGEIEKCCRRIRVRAGDVFMIPPGLIHSLGGGITVLEVQDRPGTTYRLKDIAGNRELHIREGLDSIKIYTPADAAALAVSENAVCSLPGRIIAAGCGFSLSHAVFTARESVPQSYIFCAAGSVTAVSDDGSLSFASGESLFVPENSVIIPDNAAELLFVGK